jgi:hypothetical protein
MPGAYFAASGARSAWTTASGAAVGMAEAVGAGPVAVAVGAMVAVGAGDDAGGGAFHVFMDGCAPYEFCGAGCVGSGLLPPQATGASATAANVARRARRTERGRA